MLCDLLFINSLLYICHGISPWLGSKCVRFCTGGWSVVWLSARSYQQLINCNYSLLTRRTVCGRTAVLLHQGSSFKITSESNDKRTCKNSIVEVHDHRCHKVPSKVNLQSVSSLFNFSVWMKDIFADKYNRFWKSLKAPVLNLSGVEN